MKKPPARNEHRGKRERLVRFRLSEVEYFAIESKAGKAGLHMGGYIREMAIYGKLIMRFTDEEREAIRQLIEMSRDLHDLVQLGRSEGMLTVMVYFEGYRNKFDSLFNKLVYDK